MASKGVKVARKLMGYKAKLKALEPKPILDPYLTINIKANQVTPAPPLGPTLGERGINVAQFCKEINEKTAHMVDGVPITAEVFINPDRSHRIVINTPDLQWLILRAAGIRLPAAEGSGETAGYISLKHAYEIATIKQQDLLNRGRTLEEITVSIIDEARRMGIGTVAHLDAQQYREFLELRKPKVDAYLKEQEDLLLAKTLRTGAADTKAK